MIGKKSILFYIQQIILYTIITLVAIAMLFPFWHMFISMFRTNDQIASAKVKLWPEEGLLYFTNIEILIERNFLGNIWNTFVVSVARTIGIVLFSCMAGLAFAKFKFPGRKTLLYIIIFTMMIPSQISLIPNYLLISRLGWLNTYQALVIPALASAFGIFMMRQYMSALPDEIIESSRLDGLSNWGILFRMAIPLTQAGLVVLSIITFMGSWNDFFWPLIVITKEEMYTATLRMATFMNTTLYDIVPMGSIMVGAFISSLPMIIIFIVFREKMLSGILAGSVKA